MAVKPGARFKTPPPQTGFSPYDLRTNFGQRGFAMQERPNERAVFTPRAGLTGGCLIGIRFAESASGSRAGELQAHFCFSSTKERLKRDARSFFLSLNATWMMIRYNRLQVAISTACLILALALYWLLSSTSYGQAFRFAREPQKKFVTLLRDGDHTDREPREIPLYFNITAGHIRPDGVRRRVLLINGQFPGPTIEARSGDVLEIKVENSVGDDREIALHWHGLFMRGANHMDGVVGVTQKPILPKSVFTYRFQIDLNQAGTFWYHAHSEVQRADGLYGALIVHRPGGAEKRTHKYDEDRVLLVGDWYHRDAKQVLDRYLDYRNFGNEPAPDSMLINGLGFFDCSKAVRARPVDCKSTSKPRLELEAKRTRLRVINTGALTGFNLSMSSHQMTLIQVDGGNNVEVTSPTSSIGILYPGERMDLLVERRSDEPPQDAAFTVALDPENMKFPNLALTKVQTFSIKDSSADISASAEAPLGADLDLSAAQSSVSAMEDFPNTANETLVFYTNVEILSQFGNIPKGFINRTSWPHTDLKRSPLIDLAPAERDATAFLPFIREGKDRWVDVVVNNMDDKGHPFHFHGYDFFVLSVYASPSGRHGQYNPFDTEKAPPGGALNLENPPKKDTVNIPRMGYVAFRFRADNAGLWYYHCHVLWHEAVGMAFTFDIS